MPSDPSLLQLLNLLIGSVGLGYLIYGRKQSHPLALGCGVLLMLVPYGIANLAVLTVVAMGLMLLPFLLPRLPR
jgi:hypothetical protein